MHNVWVTPAADDEHLARHHALVADATTDVIAVVRGGRVVFVTPSIQSVLGYSPDDTVGQILFDFLHPGDRAAAIEFVAACRAGEHNNVRFRLLAADGSYRTLDALVRMAGGVDDARELVFCGRDVTDSIARDRALRISEERIEALLDSGSELVMLVSRDGEYLDCRVSPGSPFAEFIDDLLGSSVADVRAPGDVAHSLLRIARVIETGEPVVYEHEVEVGGQPRYYVSRTTRFDDESVLTATRDITRERAAERAARASESQFRQIVEAANEGIWWFDRDGTTTAVNAQMAAMLGYEPAEMIGRPAQEFLDPAGEHEGRAYHERRRRGLTDRYPMMLRSRDGSEVWCVVSAVPVLGDDGAFDGTVALVANVTRERESVLRLERNEARFRALVEQTTDVFTIINRDHEVLFISDDSSRLLGSPRSLSIGELRDRRHPDDRAIVQRSLSELWRRGPGHTERYTYRMSRDDGTWRVIETIGRNLSHISGIDGLALHSRDITDRVEAEEAARESALLVERLASERERTRLQLELERAVRFERVGRLSAGIAHDFNNLLGVMSNYLRVLRRQLDDVHPGQEDAAGIAAALERAAMLTRDLLAYADAGDIPAELLDPAAVVRALVAFAGDSLGSAIAVEVAVPDVALAVRIPRVGLERCVLNLLTNARDAMPDGGRVLVHIGAVELVDGDVDELSAGRYVTVTVVDAGTGMDHAVVELAGTPFFTTKGTEGGTGLGLAIVRGIIEDAGGALRISSTPGSGTAVTLLLPRVDEM